MTDEYRERTTKFTGLVPGFLGLVLWCLGVLLVPKQNMNVNKYVAKFKDEKQGVSPVIGVILMVAITVILAAVIGNFVLGLGSQATGSNAPTANVDFTFDSNAGEVTVSHNGGENLKDANVKVLKNGNEPKIDPDGDGTTEKASKVWAGSDKQITAGETVAFSATSGDTVKVVWSAPSGDKSATLGSFTVPS